VLATRFMAFADRTGAREALAGCIRGALARTAATASDIRVVVPLGGDGELGELEAAGIADALGGSAQTWVRIRPLVGDLSAAATSFQLVAGLATMGESVAGPDALTLVTGVDRDGVVGCCLLGAGR
jgi:3-oxoacyl-[acyl-carrier-protein] synthase II